MEKSKETEALIFVTNFLSLNLKFKKSLNILPPSNG